MGTLAASSRKERRAPKQRGAAKSNNRKHGSRRTTVTFSPQSLAIIEDFMTATGLSMSDAVSELIERSEQRPARIRWVDGVPKADISSTGKWITTDDVLRAEAELL